MNIIRHIKASIHPWIKVKIKGLNKKKTVATEQLKNDGKPKVYLLDLPGHGNLGDEAIAVSEYLFLKKYCKKFDYDLMLFNIEEFIPNFYWYKKNIKKNDIILCHGGGNIGDEYPECENIRRTIIHEFKDNRIIVFPQTYFFNSTKQARKSESFGQRIYNKHKNLIIFAREEYSYKRMKNIFSKCKVFLTPDMVLNYPFVNKKNVSKEKKQVLFCMRNDAEKNLNVSEIKKMEHIFNKKGYTVKYTDTVINKMFGSDLKSARIAIDTKIRELSNADLVLTDRLHGMVLTALSSTNCIVFSNYNYKVKGVYNWLKKYKGIHFYEKNENISDIADTLKNITYKYDYKKYSEYFDQMSKIIFE